MVATSCDLNAPRCTTTVPAGTFARVPGRCLRWSPIPPGSPVTTCKNRSFTSIQMVTVLHGRHGPISHPLSFCMAGVAQSHSCLRFAWQAWHSWAWVARLGRFCRGWRRGTLRGRCGKNLKLNCFAWQAWHKLTSTFVLHGRRGAISHPPSFSRQAACRSWDWVARLGRFGRGWRRGTLRGRRGAHPPSFCMAGVAQSHIRLCFAWQACHSWDWVARLGRFGRGWRRYFAWQAWHTLTSTVICMAGVAQSHIRRRFAWQAWRNFTSAFVLRGRRATHGAGRRAWAGLVADDAAALCVAGMAQSPIHRRCPGVAQSHICLRFAWQAWRSWDWMARLTLCGTLSHPPSFCMAGVHNLTSAFVVRGRCGTHGTGWRAWAGLVADGTAALRVAGVAHIHLRFAWQAWHNLISAISHLPSFCEAGVPLMGLGGALGPVWSWMTPRHFAWHAWQTWHNLTSTFVSRGRCGAISPPSFCVAGVALMGLGPVWSWMTPRHFRGRRGTILHPPLFCVAGVAQSHIHLRFAWHAWHSWDWVARLGRFGRGWHRGTLRGRRGTISHPPSFHVAGVAQSHVRLRFAWQPVWSWVTPRHFAWQAWHHLTSTFVLRGKHGAIFHPPSFYVQGWHSWDWAAHLDWFGREWRRGTLRGRRDAILHPPSFCVAGVALMGRAWLASRLVSRLAPPSAHLHTLWQHTFSQHTLCQHTHKWIHASILS